MAYSVRDDPKLLEPAPEGYQMLKPTDLMPALATCFKKYKTGMYAAAKCKKVSSGWKEKDGHLLVHTHFVVLTDGPGQRVCRCMAVRDVEHIVLLPGANDAYTAMLRTATDDPPMRVSLWHSQRGRDPLHPLRVLVWCKRRITLNNDKIWSFVTKEAMEQEYVASKKRAKGRPTITSNSKDVRQSWISAKYREHARDNARAYESMRQSRAQPGPGGAYQQEYAIDLAQDYEEQLGVDFMKTPDNRFAVRAVAPGSAAARAGVPNGLLVDNINGVPVNDYNDVVEGISRKRAFARRPGYDCVVMQGTLGGPGLPPGSPTTMHASMSVWPLPSPFPTDDPGRGGHMQQQQPQQQYDPEGSGVPGKKGAGLRLEMPPDAGEESVAPPPPPQSVPAQPASPQPTNAIPAQPSSSGRGTPEPVAGSPAGTAKSPAPTTASPRHPRGGSLAGSGIGAAPPHPGGLYAGLRGQDAFSFTCGGDTIDFTPEGSGCIGEYLNGIRVGTATRLVYHVEDRKLVDQAGKGGPIPPLDLESNFLARLRAFCDGNHIPVELRAGGALVQYATSAAQEEIVRFDPGLGEVVVSVNGVPAASMKELKYNPVSATVSDQDGGESAPIPEEGRLDALERLQRLCDGCDVRHNIDVEEAAKFEAHRRAMEDRVVRAEERLRQEEQKSEAALRDRQRLLDEKEIDINAREEAAWHIQASPAGMYYTLKTLLADEDPEAKPIYRVLEDIPDAAFAEELLDYFDERGSGAFSRLIRSKLGPPAVHRIEGILADLGVYLDDTSGGYPRDNRPPSFRAANLATGPVLSDAPPPYLTASPVFADDPPAPAGYTAPGSARRGGTPSFATPPSYDLYAHHTPQRPQFTPQPNRRRPGGQSPSSPPSPGYRPASPYTPSTPGVRTSDWVDTLLSLECGPGQEPSFRDPGMGLNLNGRSGSPYSHYSHPGAYAPPQVQGQPPAWML